MTRNIAILLLGLVLLVVSFTHSEDGAVSHLAEDAEYHPEALADAPQGQPPVTFDAIESPWSASEASAPSAPLSARAPRLYGPNEVPGVPSSPAPSRPRPELMAPRVE